jgi:hypothetical protein
VVAMTLLLLTMLHHTRCPMIGSTSQMLDLAQMSALTPFFFVVETLLPGASLTVLAPRHNDFRGVG